MPESTERTAGNSELLAREVTTFGPGLVFAEFTGTRLLALAWLFLRVFLGMVPLQQICDHLQEVIYLDRLVQDRHVVFSGIIRRFGRGVTSQQDGGYSPAACSRG